MIYPLRVVQWELTRRCDLQCQTCFLGDEGRGENELTTGEALDLIGQFVDLGVEQVHIFGGEPYFRPDFLLIVRSLAQKGICLTFTTGGFEFPLDSVLDAGENKMTHLMLSVDGLAPTHDELRGRKGSFTRALCCLESALERGVSCGVTTQLNRRNLGGLKAFTGLLFMMGIDLWHVQLTEPFGRAARRPQLLLQPYELPQALDLLVQIKAAAQDFQVVVKPGNNIGYCTHRCRELRKDLGPKGDFNGCQQGLTYLAIQSNGAVKGCAGCAQGIGSVTANVRERRLRDIWRDLNVFSWTRIWSEEMLWGFCAACPHRLSCRGGCIQTSQALFDRPGNNPYCDYRVERLALQGRRERILADGNPQGSGGQLQVVEEEVPSKEREIKGLSSL